MKTTFIYALADPVTLEVRYIGKANDPYKRYCEHLADKSNTHKAHWIQKLLKNGLLPIRQILEECDKFVWEQREKDWIAFHKKICSPLTNGTNGGDGGPSPLGKHLSEETKKKLRLLRLGRKDGPHTKDHNKKIGLAQKGNKYNLGRKFSKEHKNKIGSSCKGKLKGRVFSEETKIKMSAARKAYWLNKKKG